MVKSKQKLSLKKAVKKPKAQGQEGGPKRTPLHLADTAAGMERYDVESIIDRALSYGVVQYLVKWRGFDKVCTAAAAA